MVVATGAVVAGVIMVFGDAVVVVFVAGSGVVVGDGGGGWRGAPEGKV